MKAFILAISIVGTFFGSLCAFEVTDFESIGPFLVAPNEGRIDPAYWDGGEISLNPKVKELPSSLVKGGLARWFSVNGINGVFHVKYPNVDWDRASQIAGISGVMNIGYFFAKLESAEDRVYLVETKNIGEFFVNGEKYWGEPYCFSYHRAAVSFKKGANQILLKVSAYGDPQFDFRLSKANSTVEILKDISLPDIVLDEVSETFWMGLPLLNTSGAWLRELSLKISGDPHFQDSTVSLDYPLGPYSVLKFPVHLKQLSSYRAGEQARLKLQVFSGEQEIAKDEIAPRIRTAGESRIETFLSHIDQSVQYYSFLPPKNFEAKQKYDLWVSLHGANVEASELIENISSKDEAFVLAPNNRRPHGFSYQDLGRKDVLEAMDVFRARHRSSRGDVFIGGHSMGGQGAWHIAVNHPTLFSGIAPSAGWTSLSMYMPFAFQKGQLEGIAEILQFRDRVLLAGQTPKFINNIRDIPVYITQSANDEIVPAFHSRFYFSKTRDSKMAAKYREIESTQHCETQPLIDGKGWNCIDEPEQYRFLNENRSKDWPKTLDVKLIDLGVEKNFYWLRVEEQERIFSETNIKVEWTGKKLLLNTNNVKGLSLQFPDHWKIPEHLLLNWNGKEVKVNLPLSKKISIKRESGQLIFLKSYPANERIEHSLKSIFYRPAIVVFGTLSSTQETEALEKVALGISQRAWRMGNIFLPVLSDREISEKDLRSRNLILIGGRERNRVSKRFDKDFLLRVEKSGVRIGKEFMRGAFSATFIAPNPLNPSFSVNVYEGVDLKSDLLATSFSPFIDRQGFTAPDFLIFTDKILQSGWGGVVGAGFFSKDWELKNRDYFLFR